MLAKRIIPCLDIKDGRTVKGTNFLELRDAGDPVELAMRDCDEGADELVFLDITATTEKRKTLARLVREIATHINIPFTVGGGIDDVEDVSILLGNGADKISVNTAAVKDPSLINRLAALVAINNIGVFLLYFVQEKFNLPGVQAVGLAIKLPLVLGICVFLFGLLAGWLCDRVDRRLLTVLSGLPGVLGVGIMVLGQTQPLMYVAAIFIGMAYAIFSVASWALSTDIIPKERSGEFLGMQNLAGAGAGAIGAYIGGAIADASGYVLLMSMFGVMFLLASLAAVFVRPEKK